MKRSPKLYYAITGVLLLLIEICIALYINDSFIRPFMGDVIVVGLIYCIFMAITNYRVITTAIITLIFSYLVEVAQYFQVVSILNLDEYRWARIIIGTSFSWWDMICYTAGFIIVLIIEKYKGLWSYK